jgi:hypothetical protein
MSGRRFCMLGAPAVESPEGEIAVAGARHRALLLRLFIAANYPVGAGRLAEDLWEHTSHRGGHHVGRATSPGCGDCWALSASLPKRPATASGSAGAPCIGPSLVEWRSHRD